MDTAEKFLRPVITVGGREWSTREWLDLQYFIPAIRRRRAKLIAVLEH